MVVTGGAGFIGANLCRELATRPGVERVVAMDNLSTGSAENLAGLDVELVEASILDRDALDEVVEGAAAVVHLAARPSVPRSVADPVASHEANATGTLRVLEACRRHDARIVAASSSSVYGSVTHLPKHEELATWPRSPYAASKLATEAYVLAYGATYQMSTLAFRFFNVYGPCRRPGTRTPPWCRPSSTPRCAARRCRCTATVGRPATSPSSARWSGCWPRRRYAASGPPSR